MYKHVQTPARNGNQSACGKLDFYEISWHFKWNWQWNILATQRNCLWNIQASQMKSCMKYPGIPNEMGYEISRHAKWNWVWNILATQMKLCLKYPGIPNEIAYEISWHLKWNHVWNILATQMKLPLKYPWQVMRMRTQAYCHDRLHTLPQFYHKKCSHQSQEDQWNNLDLMYYDEYWDLTLNVFIIHCTSCTRKQVPTKTRTKQ